MHWPKTTTSVFRELPVLGRDLHVPTHERPPRGHSRILVVYMWGEGCSWVPYLGSLINLVAVTIERYLKVVHNAWAKKNLRGWEERQTRRNMGPNLHYISRFVIGSSEVHCKIDLRQ